MTRTDWVVAVGGALCAASGLYYQLRYYRLVDQLFEFLKPLSEEEK